MAVAMDVYWQTSYRVVLVGDENNFCLSIKDGRVIVDYPNPNDLNQYWIQDYSSNEKDESGCKAFSLVNKGTGQALEHAGGGDEHTQPTKLVQYFTDENYMSTLFTESEVHAQIATIKIRLQNYINWYLYVQWGSTSKAGSEVRQGEEETVTSAVWKMEPQSEEPAWRLLLQPSNVTSNKLCLSIRNGTVVVVEIDPNDKNQLWIKDNRFSSTTDEEGYPAFALFNKGTGEAIVHQGGGDDKEQPTKLTKYTMLSHMNWSTLFTEGRSDPDGFHIIKLQNYVNWNLYVKWSAADAGEVRQCVKGYGEEAKWRLDLVPVKNSV